MGEGVLQKTDILRKDFLSVVLLFSEELCRDIILLFRQQAFRALSATKEGRVILNLNPIRIYRGISGRITICVEGSDGSLGLANR